MCKWLRNSFRAQMSTDQKMGTFRHSDYLIKGVKYQYFILPAKEDSKEPISVKGRRFLKF